MSKRSFLVALSALLIALALSGGCVAVPAPTGTDSATSTLPAATAVTTAPDATAPVATAEVSGSPPANTSLAPRTVAPVDAATSAPTGTRPAGAEGAGQSRQITLDDNGKTVTLKPGERVLLYLGEEYNWDLSIEDPTIIGRVPGVLTIRGSQGLFEAHREGTTTISGGGDPACRQSQPPCAMPSRAFEVQIVVKAGNS